MGSRPKALALGGVDKATAKDQRSRQSADSQLRMDTSPDWVPQPGRSSLAGGAGDGTARRLMPLTQARLGGSWTVLFAQPGASGPWPALEVGEAARTKPRGPLQALYFLSLPSLNPEAHPHPKEAAEVSQSPAGSPGLTQGINSQGRAWLTLS